MTDRPELPVLPLPVVNRPDVLPERRGTTGGLRGRATLLGVVALALAASAAVIGLTSASARELVMPRGHGVQRAAAPPQWTGCGSSPAVMALGFVRPDSDVVTMTVPYGAADARIASLSVTEGQRVERGAVLAVLDNERALLAAAASARATVAAREATLTQVESSVRASRGEATALLDGAHVAAKRASRELERRKALHAGGVVADDEFERYEAASEQAEHDVRRARAALSRYRAGDAGAQADALVARRNLEAARAEVVRAEAELERAYVRAPFAATVLTIEARPGERPGPEGILRLADLERMNLAIDVYETQVGRIAVGDHAEAKADALPRVLRGRVVKVGMLVGRQQTVDVNPAANTDARVIEVTVALDEQSSAVARSFTNLQVTARLCPGSAR